MLYRGEGPIGLAPQARADEFPSAFLLLVGEADAQRKARERF
jgi:hypothetical protein